MRNTAVRRICFTGIIAAIYAVTTIVLAPISYGSIQCRISESLTLLTILTPEAIWGVTLGCVISNMVGVFMGSNLLGIADIIIGSLATLLAGVSSYGFRNIRFKNIPWLSALMPVLFNALFIGAELGYVIAPNAGFWAVFAINALEVGIGEALSCFVLGIPLTLYLEKNGTLTKSFKGRAD